MDVTGKMEPFDSFWEAPEDVERGYSSFARFYRVNYLRHVPSDRDADILVISCGAGYFVKLLVDEGWRHVIGIDSDAAKVAHATARGLDCVTARAFAFLADKRERYDALVCEQELNHLTKEEMLAFLGLCRQSLKPGGRLIVHGLNGANPITGSEALAQNFDHFNSFTEYSLRQVLVRSGFDQVQVFPLDPYVFYGNPFNYVAMAIAGLLTLFFQACFILYGKKNRIFTKKIGAAARRPPAVS